MASDSGSREGDVVMVSATTQPPIASAAFTKADRIRQLNEIDKSITDLLNSAGLALKTLTSISSATTSPSATITERRDDFTTSTTTYLRALHGVGVQVNRQIIGLVEAGIISRARRPSNVANENGEEEKRHNTVLDVGWLNSRSQKVEREMEGEWWGRTRQWLEKEGYGKEGKDADEMKD